MFSPRLQLVLLFFGLTATWAFLFHVDWPKRQLGWWQKQYYQSSWKQRLRFTTTPRPGATPEWYETRLVYPCYCYKPSLEDLATASPVEKRIIEPKEVFFLNK
ncbi:uncharacterized protein LOC128254686 [Drosophila gunungcola]|uniref:Uncharacterized protein n=1 Tax=Drosophila gunungcola TaxID=103775 RepID=A0A9Q0BNL0_9MUSC|nr:uncharacterized protein LOC128254686 [Drosophila gunungcola]KAI8038827.1 hypothetical protein M5D96_008736 [Drosophila gunungcola]